VFRFFDQHAQIARNRSFDDRIRKLQIIGFSRVNVAGPKMLARPCGSRKERIIAACMRKLLVILNTMVRNQTR
jgi:hypothetical protein